MRSIKNAYVKELRKKQCAEDDGEVSALPSKKRGRPVLLGQELDQKVQLYLKKVREGGGAVSTRIVIAAAAITILECLQSLEVLYRSTDSGPIHFYIG